MVFFILEVSWIVLHGVLYEAARRCWNATGYRQLVEHAPRAAHWLRMAYQLIIAVVWWWGLLLLESPYDETGMVVLILMQPQWSALYRSLRWHLGGKTQAARQAAQAATRTQQITRAIADLATAGLCVTQIDHMRYEVRHPTRVIRSVTGLQTADDLLSAASIVRAAQVWQDLYGVHPRDGIVRGGFPPQHPSRN
jgi:hypothetical protein